MLSVWQFGRICVAVPYPFFEALQKDFRGRRRVMWGTESALWRNCCILGRRQGASREIPRRIGPIGFEGIRSGAVDLWHCPSLQIRGRERCGRVARGTALWPSGDARHTELTRKPQITVGRESFSTIASWLRSQNHNRPKGVSIKLDLSLLDLSWQSGEGAGSSQRRTRLAGPGDIESRRSLVAARPTTAA